jgi:hypothetical protein
MREPDPTCPHYQDGPREPNGRSAECRRCVLRCKVGSLGSMIRVALLKTSAGLLPGRHGRFAIAASRVDDLSMSVLTNSATGLLSPGDVAVKVMVWFGAPAIMVLTFSSILILLNWKSFLQSTARVGASASRAALANLRYWTTERQRAFVKLTVASSAFIAVAYSFSQLVGWFVTSLRETPAFWKQDHIDWHIVLDQILVYQRWSAESRWTVLGSAILIALLNIADLCDLHALRNLIVGLGYAVLGTALVAACFGALGWAAPLLIGILFMHAPVWLLVLELIAIACLAVLPYLGRTIRDASRRAYTYRSTISSRR